MVANSERARIGETRRAGAVRQGAGTPDNHSTIRAYAVGDKIVVDIGGRW